MGKRLLQFAGVVLVLAALAGAADLSKVTFHFKNIAIPGALFTTAAGVNNAGTIVGNYVDASGITHGFMLSGTSVTTIDDPNGIATYCEGINSSGAIVGEYTRSNDDNHGFLFQNGVFTDIGMGVISGATAINDLGIIVGGFLDCSVCSQHGFSFDGTTYTTLTVPGETYTGPTGINNKGVVAITGGDTSAVYHAYTYDGTTYTKIDPPGYADSYATGINNLGDVSLTVIKFQGQEESKQGAVLHAGKYFFYNYQNQKATLTSGAGINDHREIVGGYEEGLAKGLTIGGFSTSLF